MMEQDSFLQKQRQLEELRRIKQLLLAGRDEKQRGAHLMEKVRKRKLQNNEKVHIVFVCHRPSVWGTLKTACEAFLSDPGCQVTIVAIPNKKQLPTLQFGHEEYIDEGAYDFFQTYPCRVIKGYNPSTRSWVNLQQLEPDYIFFQTSYNICRPPMYNSRLVSQYARLAYSNYGISTLKGEVADSVNPPDFMQDLHMAFCQTPEYLEYLKAYYAALPVWNRALLFLTGDARFDSLIQAHHTALPLQQKNSPPWRYPRSSRRQRILWTPRWCLSENNSHLIDYKDNVLSLCDASNDVELVFRPHPQTFEELTAQGVMTPKEVDTFKTEFTRRENCHLDLTGEYQSTMLSSDVLITDVSSIIHEYVMTGKPIIYCHKQDWFLDFSRKVAEGFYWAHSWQDVETVLAMLRRGEDPLREKRLALRDSLYFLPPEGSGTMIKNYIMQDWRGQEAVMPSAP